MTKAKGRVRQEKRLKEVQGGPELLPELIEIDPEDESLQVEEFQVYLDETGVDRLFTRLVFGERRQLVDFCFEQQFFDGVKWQVVVRFDCAHGDVHAHYFYRLRREQKKRIIAELEEIEKGADIAEGALYDGWQENRRRYLDE